MNFRDIIKKEFLFEEKKEKSGALKVFYNIDIKIKDEKDPEKSVPPPVQEPVQAPAPTIQEPNPALAPTLPVQESINEEDLPVEPEVGPGEQEPNVGKDIIKHIDGVISLSKDDVENIQTIDDLLDLLGDKKHDGQDLLDDLTIEVITSLVGNPEAMKAQNLLKKDDQIIISLAFGYKKDDSVGIKILKRRGVSSVSIMMTKDNEVLDSPFDTKRFNGQIVAYRNETINK